MRIVSSRLDTPRGKNFHDIMCAEFSDEWIKNYKYNFDENRFEQCC